MKHQNKHKRKTNKEEILREENEKRIIYLPKNIKEEKVKRKKRKKTKITKYGKKKDV